MVTAGETRPGQTRLENLGWRQGGATGLSKSSHTFLFVTNNYYNSLIESVFMYFFPQKGGIECMKKIALSESRLSKHLIPAARYNIGRAYFQGFGDLQSDDKAEK